MCKGTRRERKIISGVEVANVALVWGAEVGALDMGEALTILPRQGEVAGSCQTEGEASDNFGSVSSPSVAFGATSPWRGRIERLGCK